MTNAPFDKTPLAEAVNALRKDLLAEGGPRISTMRNYRFAILPYDPRREFETRRRIRQLCDELKGEGWRVVSISLKGILLDLLKAEEPRVIESVIARERRLYAKDPGRALRHLKDKLTLIIEEPNGVAGEVIKRIDAGAEGRADQKDRTLILIDRAGALYPFFHTSALLKYIDGKTSNFPVALLYPGERRDLSALSFMGELPADRDYRPRIY